METIILKTNRNRNNHFHDNVNYVPLEIQLSKILERFYDDVKFEASGGNLKFKINKDFFIYINLNEYNFVLKFYGNDFLAQTQNVVSTSMIEYNTNFYNVINNFVKDIKDIREKDEKILKIIDKIIDKKNRKKYFDKVNKYLEKYFNSEFIKASSYNNISNFFNIGIVGSYFCISISLNKELFGNNKGAVQVPIGFDGKIIQTHPYNGNNIFQDCVEIIQIEKNHAKEGFLNLDTLKKIVKELEIIEKRLENFNAFDCPEFKEILEINKECYEFLTKK